MSRTSRCAFILANALPLAASAILAAPAAIEGLYRFGGNEPVTIRIIQRQEEFEGVVVSAESDWHRRQLNQTVLVLRRAGPNEFRGRCNAYHMHASEDMTAWLEVAKAEALDAGDLQCLLKIPSGGSAQIVYKKVVEPPREGEGAAEHDRTGLAGEWRTPDGTVVHYRREGEWYVGEVVKLRLLDPGPPSGKGDPTIRVKLVRPGVYVGAVSGKGEDGKEAAAEAIEITVAGDRLTSVRVTKGGEKIEATAARVSKYSLEPEAKAPPPPEADEGDLTGLWRSHEGDLTRYERAGNAYTGYVVKVAPNKEPYGFRPGEVGVRLKRISDDYYIGKVLAKTKGGRDQFWDDVEFTVRKGRLTYIRHLGSGKQEKGGAVRVGGLQPREDPRNE